MKNTNYFVAASKKIESEIAQGLYFDSAKVAKKISVNQVEELRKMTDNKYKFCGPKIVYGEDAGRYLEWRDNYLRMYKAVKGDFD